MFLNNQYATVSSKHKIDTIYWKNKNQNEIDTIDWKLKPNDLFMLRLFRKQL